MPDFPPLLSDNEAKATFLILFQPSEDFRRLYHLQTGKKVMAEIACPLLNGCGLTGCGVALSSKTTQWALPYGVAVQLYQVARQ